MSGNTRFLIFLIVIGFIGISFLITGLYFDRKKNKRVREILKEEKGSFFRFFRFFKNIFSISESIKNIEKTLKEIKDIKK